MLQNTGGGLWENRNSELEQAREDLARAQRLDMPDMVAQIEAEIARLTTPEPEPWVYNPEDDDDCGVREAEQGYERWLEDRGARHYDLGDYMEEQALALEDLLRDDELHGECGDLDREEYEAAAADEDRYGAYLRDCERDSSEDDLPF